MRILFQALAAAPGGSISGLKALLDHWPDTDTVRVVLWRQDSADQLADSNHEVVKINARSTLGAAVKLSTMHRCAVTDWRPDVVLSQQYFLPSLGRPQVIHHRNLLRFDYGGRPSRKARLLTRLTAYAIRSSDGNVFNSAMLATAARKSIPDIDEGRIRVVHNPIDVDFWAQFDSPQRNRLVDGRVRILVPQADAPYKRNVLAVDAVHRLMELNGQTPDSARYELMFVGSGTYDDVRMRAAQFGLAGAVSFTGYVSREKLGALYASADAVLITSTRESFCNPNIEAQAVGVPVVSTPLPVLRETAGPLNRISTGDSPSAIAHALQESLLVGVTLDGIMAARRHAQAYGATRIAGQMRAAVRDLAGLGPGHS